MSDELFTIGHSNHDLDRFLHLLKAHAIDLLCDVRSQPVSRLPHFCKRELSEALTEAGITYAFAGAILGARSTDPKDYLNGQVQFSKLARKPLFQKAIERLVHTAQSKRVALMCAEAEPLECHRTILVARAVVEAGVTVHHILPDGTLESHSDAMLRLTRKLDLPVNHLFISQEKILSDAYREQEKRVAFRNGNAHDASSQPAWELAV